MVSWYTSSHLTRLVDPSYFSIHNSLKFRDQRTLHKFTFERGFDGELVHLEPLGWVGGPIVLLNPQRLEVQGSTDPLQVMRERLDPPFIVFSIWTIVEIIPLLTLFELHAVSLSWHRFLIWARAYPLRMMSHNSPSSQSSRDLQEA
jgi:hypothetical protein